MVGALIDVGIGDDQQDALRRALDQAACGFEHGGAGAFGADQRARDVEAVFRQQVVQVVAGDAAGNIREASGGSGRRMVARFASGRCRFALGADPPLRR